MDARKRGVWHYRRCAGSARAKGFSSGSLCPGDGEHRIRSNAISGREHFQSHGPARVILGRSVKPRAGARADDDELLDVAFAKGEKWRLRSPDKHTVA